MKKQTGVIFYAHNHKVNGPKTNEDIDVTFNVDISQSASVAPLLAIAPNTAFKIEVTIQE